MSLSCIKSVKRGTLAIDSIKASAILEILDKSDLKLEEKVVKIRALVGFTRSINFSSVETSVKFRISGILPRKLRLHKLGFWGPAEVSEADLHVKAVLRLCYGSPDIKDRSEEVLSIDQMVKGRQNEIFFVKVPSDHELEGSRWYRIDFVIKGVSTAVSTDGGNGSPYLIDNGLSVDFHSSSKQMPVLEFKLES